MKQKRAAVFVAIALFGFAFVPRPANAVTVPVNQPTATPTIGGLQVVIADLINGAGSIVASIESGVGGILADITNTLTGAGPSTNAVSDTAAAAAPLQEQAPNLPQVAAAPSPQQPTGTTTVVTQTIVEKEQPAVETAPSTGIVTKADLSGFLTSFKNLLVLLPSSSIGAGSADSTNVQQQLAALQREIAQTNQINNLSNVTLTSPTIIAPTLTGLSTSQVSEGSNFYFSNARVASYINSSSTIPSAAGTLGNILSWNGSSWAAVATSTLGFAGGGAGTWGSITGSLASQTDLQSALNARLSLSSWYATTTDGLAQGSTNKYFSNALAQAAISVSATPLTYSSGVIGLNQASGSQPGFLASADWTNFNGKLASSSLSAGTGVGYNSATGVISNAGVTSDAAGTGISLSGGTGAVTITNSGVTSLAASYPLLTTGSTGSLTLSLGFGTTTANAWSASQIFNGGASTTNLIATNGTTTNLAVTGTSYVGGSFGVGTTTPGSIFSVQGVANWTGATSTYYATGGINLTNGCFSINGACLPSAQSVLSQTVPNTGASFTGSITGAILTVSSISSGIIYVSQQILGPNITTPTTVSFGLSGTGGTGTYVVNVSHSVASETMTSIPADVFAGPYSGNLSTAGTGNVAVGFQAGSSLTVPASWANPQADTFLGYQAGMNVTTGRESTFIGFEAGQTITGGGTGIEDGINTFIGSQAGLASNASSSDDVFIGQKAGLKNATGTSDTFIGTHGGAAFTGGNENVFIGHAVADTGGGGAIHGSFNTLLGGANSSVAGDINYNVAVGYGAGSRLTSVDGNTLIGYLSGQNITTGTGNTYLGFNSGHTTTTGQNDTYLGYNAGQAATSSDNVLIGFFAGPNAITADHQTIIGSHAGLNLTTGANNTFLGYQSGYGVTTGAGNVLLGYSTIAASQNQVTSGSNNIAIGNDVAIPSPTSNNQLDIGNFIYGTGLSGTAASVSPAFLGFGTTTPYSRLEVWGSDTASTSAFAVVNSASTTEFAVLDNGNATLAGNLIQNSDQRLKTNIQSLDTSDSLAAINALNPVTFNWIDPAKGFVPQYGFVAQDVQRIFPNLVSVTAPTALTPDGTLSLNYIDLIAPIVKAIQQLDQELTSLASAIASLAESFTTKLVTAGEVDTTKLCIQGTCVTGSQLNALLASANQSSAGTSEQGPTLLKATETPPVIQINGDNPAVIHVGASYNDLGATITGPQADLNLGSKTFLNGALVSNIVIDTTAAATDTIDYVVSDSHGLTGTSTRTVIVEPAAGASTPPPSVSPADASTSAATTTTP